MHSDTARCLWRGGPAVCLEALDDGMGSTGDTAQIEAGSTAIVCWKLQMPDALVAARAGVLSVTAGA